MIVMEHGSVYFVDKGIRCPECGSSKFMVSIITRKSTEFPAEGVYELQCRVCDCKWQEVCK